MGRRKAFDVRADHGVWSAGWRLAVSGVARSVTRTRRLVLLISLAAVLPGLVGAVVAAALRGSDSGAGSVVPLLVMFVLLAYLVAGVELILWTLSDRRTVAPADIDAGQLAHVRAEIAERRGARVDPADRRAVSRFARVQQRALPATLLVQVMGVSAGLMLAVLAAFSGVSELVILVLAVLIVSVCVWLLVGAVRALGSTVELVALDAP